MDRTKQEEKKKKENRLVLGNGLGYDMSLNLYNSIWLIGPINYLYIHTYIYIYIYNKQENVCLCLFV